jgi:TRAP-type mannitol/chloroaromatic compound transport system permease large subunit
MLGVGLQASLQAYPKLLKENKIMSIKFKIVLMVICVGLIFMGCHHPTNRCIAGTITALWAGDLGVILIINNKDHYQVNNEHIHMQIGVGSKVALCEKRRIMISETYWVLYPQEITKK